MPSSRRAAMSSSAARLGRPLSEIVGGGMARQNLPPANPRKAACGDQDQQQHGDRQRAEHADDPRVQPSSASLPGGRASQVSAAMVVPVGVDKRNGGLVVRRLLTEAPVPTLMIR